MACEEVKGNFLMEGNIPPEVFLMFTRGLDIGTWFTEKNASKKHSGRWFSNSFSGCRIRKLA